MLVSITLTKPASQIGDEDLIPSRSDCDTHGFETSVEVLFLAVVRCVDHRDLIGGVVGDEYQEPAAIRAEGRIGGSFTYFWLVYLREANR